MAKDKNNLMVADAILNEWLTEDGLMLIECFCRDGFTLADIANRIGVSTSQLAKWAKEYPELGDAIKRGKEIVDYMVENALLKSALGYKTHEVKVTTTMRYGKVVETITEDLEKEVAPNINAIQTWLYNRCKDKWKNMNNSKSVVDLMDEDSSIEITVTRASQNESGFDNGVEDGKEVTVRKRSKAEQAEIAKNKEAEPDLIVDETDWDEVDAEEEAIDVETVDLDEWPDDWDEGED